MYGAAHPLFDPAPLAVFAADHPTPVFKRATRRLIDLSAGHGQWRGEHDPFVFCCRQDDFGHFLDLLGSQISVLLLSRTMSAYTTHRHDYTTIARWARVQWLNPPDSACRALSDHIEDLGVWDAGVTFTREDYTYLGKPGLPGCRFTCTPDEFLLDNPPGR